tara:strand:- start:4276 stop:4653 length:378 start_codon:yes stop_codon:yes gene_type:complete
MVDCSKVYVANSGICDGYGVFSKINFKTNAIIETGISKILTNCNGHENPHLFTWSDDIPNKIWAMTSGCATFYNTSNTPNVKMIRNFATNTYQFVALTNIQKDTELFHTYKSINWRKCFDTIKNL